MKIIYNKQKLIKLINNENNLGFVPTMGTIHEGHTSLIKRSNALCNKTIVTIFVNKLQFDKKIDFKNYPKNLKNDFKLLKKTKVDYLFIPKNEQIHPNGINQKIKIISFSKKLCGKFRPGHFKAVVDVVEKFSQIINPSKIFLGEKDMQQLLIIKHFFKQKYKNIKIIGCKTMREKNGMAFSSRNVLLTKKQKTIGSKIFKFIKKEKANLIKHKITTNIVKKKMLSYGVKRIDYVKIINLNKITKKSEVVKKYKVFISYYLGETRLIDNI